MEKALELLKQYKIDDFINEIKKMNLSEFDIEKLNQIVLNDDSLTMMEQLIYSKYYCPDFYKQTLNEILKKYMNAPYDFSYDLVLYVFENSLDKIDFNMIGNLFIKLYLPEQIQKFKNTLKRNQWYDKFIDYIILEKDPMKIISLVLYYEPKYLNRLFQTVDNLVNFIIEESPEKVTSTAKISYLMCIALNSTDRNIVIKIKNNLPIIFWKSEEEYREVVERFNITLFSCDEERTNLVVDRHLKIMLLQLDDKIEKLI